MHGLVAVLVDADKALQVLDVLAPQNLNERLGRHHAKQPPAAIHDRHGRHPGADREGRDPFLIFFRVYAGRLRIHDRSQGMGGQSGAQRTHAHQSLQTVHTIHHVHRVH